MIDFEVITDKAKRLEDVRLALGINKSELARRIDSPQAHISKLLSGQVALGEYLSEKIVRRLRLSATWWETGEGEMFLASTDEPIPESEHPSMAEETQHTYSPFNASERSNGKNNMWVVPAKAQAGFIKGFMRRAFSHQIERTSFPMIQGECFCFEVEGFSMYPMYLPGSYVVSTLLEDWEWMRKGKAYVFHTDDGISVKLFEGIVDGSVYLSSDNPTYNPVAPLPLTTIRQVYAIEYKINKD